MYKQSSSWEQSQSMAYKLLFLVFLKIALCFAKQPRSEYSIADTVCADYDSCSRHKFFRTCSCDEDCSRYDTCCWDAPEKNTYPVEQFECYSKDISQAVFVKMSCNPSYNDDSDVISFCENDQQDWSDLMANILVSSNRTWITYKNWNCAICNGENVRDLWFWTVQASYPLDIIKRRLNVREFRQNFIFDEQFKQWGVYDDETFINCPLEFNQPSHLHGELRFCAGNITSDCPSVWTDDHIRRKCHSFYGERKEQSSKTYYRNVYCALCNGFDIADLDCSGRHYKTMTSSSNRMAMRVIYNLNPWTGEHTDNYMSCSSDSRYDPFLKICRSVTCGLKHPKQFDKHCMMISDSTNRLHTYYITYILFVTVYLMVMM